MLIRRSLSAGLTCTFLIAGCASSPAPRLPVSQSPAPQPQATVTTHRVQLVSAEVETGEPATLLEEPHLEAPHDVAFFVQIALQSNPEILAARRAVAAQSHVIPQVTALDDPIVTDSFQPFDSYSVQTAAGRGPNTLTLTQKLPWRSKLRVRGEVAQQNV